MNDETDALSRIEQADSDAVMQAARYYLAERTDDIDRDEMLTEMTSRSGDADAVRQALATLSGDTASLEAASRTFLQWASSDPAERPRIERALDAAKQKLPVVEIAALAMVALYGMYLVTTGGKKSETTSATEKSGGTIFQTKTEYYPHPLSSVVDLFRGGGRKKD